MKITVNLSGNRPEPWIEDLRAELPDARISAWRAGDEQADHAVVWMPTQEFLDQQSGLRGLFNIGAGVDALLGLRLPPQARIVRLDDAGMSVQMAEYVCHAVIRHFREFDVYDAEARAGRWSFRKPRLRHQFPVGVMGLGVLGTRVAKSIGAFEFPVTGWSRSPKRVDGVRCFSGAEGFDEFLAASRVLVCLLPLTAETRGILRREHLLKLNGGQPGGYVINVARGAHLVEADLLQLLDEQRLDGAALDVFETEPLSPEHAFWREPRIAITPHGAARTLRRESVAQIASKLRALEAGADLDSLPGVVRLERGY